MESSDRELVLITEYFHPDTASTGQLMTDLAVGLKERGLNLRVVTGQPNYHSGENEKQPRVMTFNGVEVRRIRAPQVRQTSLPRRLFNWIVFSVWMFFAMIISRPERPREFIFVSNPPFLPIVMWLACRIRGWNYTYIVYDLYPDQPVELGHIRKGGLIDRIWSYLNVKALRSADHIVALGSKMKDRIKWKAGPDIEPGKIEIIHNWADGRLIQPLEKEANPFAREHDLVEPFVLLYSGNIGEFHDLETLLRGAAAFKDDDVVVLIIGEGDNKATVVNLAEELGLKDETVRFLPYQPLEVLPYSLTAGDVSVVAVREGFEGVCVSSKLYTAMAAGMPILCIAQPNSDESRIVERYDAGRQVEQSDVDGVVEAIEWWRADAERRNRQGENARVAFEDSFTKARAIDAYHELLVG